MVANATGLVPDVPEFHAPIARTPEIADVLVPAEMGGVLHGGGRVDVVNSLRRPDEAGFAGGVFVVVRCEDRKTWEVLRAKGHVVSRSGNAAMIYRPSHLLGVESATTVLSAVLHGRSSGPDDIQPRFDVVGKTNKRLKAGTILEATGHHHQIDGVDGLLLPARAATGANPIPFYLMAGNLLRRDIAAGAVITADMVAPPKESRLWGLRRELEETFTLR